MQKIHFSNKLITLEFVVDDNSVIKMTYLGSENNFINFPSTFVEIETNECDHLGSHCAKQCNTPFGKNAKYVSHKIINNELVITVSDNNLLVNSHIILRNGALGFTCYNEVVNISENDIYLEYVSSCYIDGLGQKDIPSNKDMFVYYASNSWNTEAQVTKESFIDANIFNGNNRLTMKKFALNNVGSWSSKEYLPLIGIENVSKKQFILGEVEHNGSWHIEIGDNENRYYVSLCGPEMMDSQWCKCLKQNESFVTVPVSISLGKGYEEAVQEMSKIRRDMIDKNHVDYVNQPVIFNDFMHGTWDRSSEELIKPYVDGANEVRVDTFVIDAGWFSETTGWGVRLGDYDEASVNFPHGGLKGLCDYIRNKGMKVGLWFEIENIGINAKCLNEMNENYFMHINGKRIIRNSRYCLNFNKKEAFCWAFKKISDAINKYNLDYIKIDYNLDLGVGSNDSSAFLGNELLNHNRKVIELINELKNKHPNVTFENCASGGQRLDYAMLKNTQLASTSDLENYKLYPYISGNIYLACLPEQAGIWAYPKCNDTENFDITNEVVIFNMVNGLAGRLTLASKIYELNNEQKGLVKEGVILAKEMAEYKKQALPIFPNGPTRFYKDSVAFGLIRIKEIKLFVFNTKNEPQNVKIDLSKYQIIECKQLYPKEYNVETVIKDNILEVKFLQGYMGRIFDIRIK